MDNWSPDLRSVPQPVAYHKLLKKAVWKLYSKGVISNPYEVLKDYHGTFGFRYGQFILVAKEKPYGDIVSIHTKAILRAMEFKISIVMWLESAGKFYMLNPFEIFKEAKPSDYNYKGTAEMINFSVRKLTNVMNW